MVPELFSSMSRNLMELINVHMQTNPSYVIVLLYGNVAKIPANDVKNFAFHQVHCIGYKNPANKCLRPIAAKF